ncbi:MAG: thermonuclease family protein [Candidatus Eisenbacteria bacterium]
MKRRLQILSLFLVLAIAISCASRATLEPKEAVPVPKDRIHYDDGDTFSFDDITIRVLGIDTPEIAHPEHGFPIGQPFGPEAAERAEELLRAADRITYLPFRNDQYGRLLAHVFIDGELLGIKLIEEHLAYETVSHYGDNGRPEIAAAILKAAKKAGDPPFRPPHEWRRENRVQATEESGSTAPADSTR